MSTKIEWATEVWNPVTGCTPISEGCQNCYAKRMAQRLKGRFGYPEDEPFKITFHPDKLNQPLRWRKPRQIFVVSMGDLWHSDNDWPTIDMIFNVCDQNKQHTYLFLTKRIEAAWYYFKSPIFRNTKFKRFEYLNRNENIYLGVSCENQVRADERIPILLQIPAAKHFVSLEPLLGPVDLDQTCSGQRLENGWCWRSDLDWVIVGGESGPGARPMHPDWVRSVRDQCIEAGVPFFFKQWGEWIDATHMETTRSHLGIRTDEMMLEMLCMRCVGKKQAGRLLDGYTWDEMP